MDSSGNREIVAILIAVVVLAVLVYLFGLPLLIWVAVIASFAALALLVWMSAGDLFQKTHH
jgi:hypothetical protein